MRINIPCIAFFSVMFFAAGSFPVSAQADAQAAKSEVEKRVRENKTKVTVETRSGGKVKGAITSTAEDSFTVTKDNQPTTVSYSEVSKIKNGGWSTGKKAGIIAAIGGAVTGLVLYLAFKAATRDN